MSTRRILVADDEPHLLTSLTFVLQKEGYEVATAADGEEALQKMHLAKPDLVFLDIMMPKKNGYEVSQEIRNSPDLKDIYIIMLSAKGQEIDREKGLSAGANEFITKPFSPLAVVTRVKSILS